MNCGFMIVAQNNRSTNYIKCAEVLAKSLKNCMPHCNVTLLTDVAIKNSNFDQIVTFPHGDRCLDVQWKLENDWQVYDASPYTHTIKLEADMYVPRSIDHWWDILKDRDLFVSTTIRNYKGQISSVKHYRGTVLNNKLPDTYNAITYFRKSDLAAKFYEVVRDIFSYWDSYKEILHIHSRELASTDIVYSLAARIIGEEKCTDPALTSIGMIHMKKEINLGVNSDWSKEFVYEINKDSLRINTIPQLYPFHYHIKNFVHTLDEQMKNF